MAFLTIVTVCYNAEAFIEATIQSVMKQHLREMIEYIVVDGASTDNTINLVHGFDDEIDILISEPDKGIYDAMNKGLNAASGTYILFLNAGDYLYSNDIIKTLYDNRENVDIFYGETYLIDGKNNILGTRTELTSRKLPNHLTPSSFKKGLVVSHQSFIPKKSIAPQYIPNNLSADIDWVIRCTQSATNILNINGVISCFLIGGISDQKHFRSLIDRGKIMIYHYGWIQAIFIHCYIVARAILGKIFIRI